MSFASTATNTHKSGSWQCSIWKDKQTSVYIAHCLNLDLKVAGKDQDEAWSNLKRVMVAHYEYCVAYDPDGLNVSASARAWEAYNTAFEQALKEGGSRIRMERLELRVPLPSVPDQIVPLAYQGVEFADAVAA